MDTDTITEAEARNAAKVAGFAAVITLTGALAIKAQRVVAARIRERRLTPKHLTVEK